MGLQMIEKAGSEPQGGIHKVEEGPSLSRDQTARATADPKAPSELIDTADPSHPRDPQGRYLEYHQPKHPFGTPWEGLLQK